MLNRPIEILIVEDNPNDAELTLRALDKHKLVNKSHVVRDGEEALEFLFATGRYADRSIESPPQVVLLDLKLPKLDGFDVLRRMRTDERTKRIPVVILTSSKQNPDIEAAYELGANSFVTKPVEFDAFVKAVSDVGLYWLLLNQPPP